MTHTEKCLDYIRRIIAGDIPACQQIKKACARTLRDFERQTDSDFPYFYDEAQAERVCTIIEQFKHVKGRWAARREHIELRPWQCWIVCTLYGWKRKVDGTRKYRRGTLIITRKQGKSLLAAALMIYHLLFDGEYGAECYCGASNLKQAKEIFSATQQMLINEPDLRDQTGAEVNAASIVVLETNSKAEPVIGKPKDGANVSFAVLDETHQMRNLDLLESFQTGTGARTQPLILSVSTAGFGLENPCRQLQMDAEKVLNGIVEDDELFIAIYTIDAEVDWKSDVALTMANPNQGVSVTMDFLRAAQKDAINNPSKAASFKTKHLDITCASSGAFYSIDKWNACKDAIKLEHFDGEPCWMAFDLSNKLDLTAISTVFKRDIEGQTHYYAFSDAFIPDESVSESPLYTQWMARDLLHVTEGNTIDYTALEALILAYSERFKIQEIGFDPWHSDFFVQSLRPKLSGTEFIEVLQRATHLTTPMNFLQELTYNKRIHHSGDPVLTFGISNVIAKRFGNLIMPDKEKPESKIDAAVALIMALKLASVAPTDDQSDAGSIIFA